MRVKYYKYYSYFNVEHWYSLFGFGVMSSYFINSLWYKLKYQMQINLLSTKSI